MLVQSVPVAAVPTLAQSTTKDQTQPGQAVAAAAGAKAVPDVHRDAYVFAAAQASAPGAASQEDASNANDREAEIARKRRGTMSSIMPPPRRDEDDPAANFIPEPRPLVGPAPARVPLLGFDVGGNPALEEARRLAQAEQAYRSPRSGMSAEPTLADHGTPDKASDML